MKKVILASIVLAMMACSGVASAKSNVVKGCGASAVKVTNGKITFVEDGKKTVVDLAAVKDEPQQTMMATTKCRSGGGITVCSNGKYGCVWSDRTGDLLGCGAGVSLP